MRGFLGDGEWGFFKPFLIETGALRGRPPRDHRRTLDAVFWIARTGAPRHDLPEELGNWNSVHRQYRRWTASGLWDLMLEALAEGGGADAVQMVDSTITGYIIMPLAQRGDSKPGSWPLARRLLKQNPCPEQR